MTLYFTPEHEWLQVEGDTATVGITDHAQAQLGDIVFVEPPKVGRKLAAGESVGVVESVKAASDIYAPIAGEVVATNDELGASPERINADAYGAWMYRLKPADPADLAKLLDSAAYEKASAE